MRRGGPPSRLEIANRLADVVARKYAGGFGGAVSLADLRGLASEGAAEALRKWDGRGLFEAFALQRIRWAVLRGARRQFLRHQTPAARDEVCALLATERAADTLDEAPEGAQRAATAQELLQDAVWGYRFELLQAEAAAELADPEQDVERDADRIRLRRAVSRLPPPENRVLERRLYEDETFVEIALALGMSRSAVHEAYHRGRRRLEELLSPSSVREPASTEVPSSV